MSPLLKTLALALVGALALANFEAPVEAREPVVKKRQARQAPPRHRLTERAYVPASAIPAGRYAAPADPRMPYGGPGRAQFEPVVVGPQPERADGRTPEGP
jgi:hypothetical protein